MGIMGPRNMLHAVDIGLHFKLKFTNLQKVLQRVSEQLVEKSKTVRRDDMFQQDNINMIDYTHQQASYRQTYRVTIKHDTLSIYKHRGN